MGSYRKVAMNGLIRFTILIEHVTGLYAKYKWNVFCPLISLLGLWAANLHPTTPPVQTHTHTLHQTLLSVEWKAHYLLGDSLLLREPQTLHFKCEGLCTLTERLNWWDLTIHTNVSMSIGFFSSLCWAGEEATWLGRRCARQNKEMLLNCSLQLQGTVAAPLRDEATWNLPARAPSQPITTCQGPEGPLGLACAERIDKNGISSSCQL